MAQFTKRLSAGGNQYDLILDVNQSSQSIANNTSAVSWSLWIRKNSGSGYRASDTKNWSVNIGGQTKSGTIAGYNFSGKNSISLGSGSFTIAHSSDGTKSISASGTFTDSGVTGIGSGAASGSLALTAIPRTSSFTIPTSFTVGSAFTVSISRASSSFTHWVRLSDGNTILFDTDSSVGTSQSVNVAASTLIARMSGVASKAFTVTVWTYSGGTVIGNTSKTITANIPTSTFTAPGSFTMGNAFTVSISRVGSLTHWVRLSDGSVNLFDTDSSVGTSQSVNVALSTLAGRSPNAMSKVFTVTVWTYSGGTVIGSTSKNITANVPSTVKPTFSAVTVSENVSSVASLVGAYVQTKSKLNLAITGASGIHGSTIRSYNITGVGHNSNSWSTVTDYLSVSGNQTITGTIIDSRGQTFVKSVVVNILPYTAPTLSDLSFRRTLPDKTEAPLGDNATVRANVKVQSLIVNGVEKNSIKYHVQSAQSGGSFADKAYTTHAGLTKSYSDVWVGYSVDHSYNFRVRAGDIFQWGGWSVGVVPTGIVTQQWSSKTTSFGKMIDNTNYNVQVGSGGIQSDGPIVDRNGREVPGVKSIPGNDLNNAMAPGFYYWTTGVTNSPTDYGSMIVTAWNGTGVGETADQLVMKNGSIWSRGKNNAGSAWSAWATVSKNGHTHTADSLTGRFTDVKLAARGFISSQYNGQATLQDHNNGNVTLSAAGGDLFLGYERTNKVRIGSQELADFVIETGSNSNGTYEKWRSGKLVQKHSIAVPAGASVAWGTMFYKYINGTNWTFPVPFLNRRVVVTGSSEDYSSSIQTDGIHNTRASGVHLMRPAAFTNGTTVSLIAEGRWK